ncbi:MAG: FeoB-associated Cys-rich membrane protein [Armatimonadetes bacterium]|nr:FeoB-associated Cys-rich membrane protein [Armatimonadota bacterium]MDW8027407.1 FeoB-associated Cys-rich membrane protein [Armatimonadota bacterium]
MEGKKTLTVIVCVLLIIVAGLLIYSHVKRSREGFIKEASVEAVQREIERIQKDPNIPPGVKANLIRQLQSELARAQTKQTQAPPTAP